MATKPTNPTKARAHARAELPFERFVRFVAPKENAMQCLALCAGTYSPHSPNTIWP